MGNHSADRPVGLLASRRLVRGLLTVSLLTGCDRGAADLAREIDAAREGCTEEMLKAGDEVCVRMFETYADMAAGAMETYIGGMRAFDEAIQRRGGLQFDTAGLGRAVGDGWGGAADSIGTMARPYQAGRASDPMQTGYIPMADPYAGGTYDGVAGGRWSDPVAGDEVPAQLYPPAQPTPPGRQTAQPVPRPAPGRRGVLLPPEERLRRPWIDDTEGGEPYVGEVPPRDAARTPNGQQPTGWNPYPNAAPGGYPYPYGGPGGTPYPYGGVGASPYAPSPYGSPGTYPYPGGGPGVAYPYPDPFLEGYPYPNSRRGGW